MIKLTESSRRSRRTTCAGRLSALAVATAGALALSGCGALGVGSGSGSDGSPASTSTDTPVVAAAFYPLAWASERVAGDRAEVINLTTPGTEPHDLEIGVQQTADIGAADLVVHIDGFQPAVDAAAEQSGAATLDVAQAVDLQSYEGGHDGHDDHEGEDHEAEESGHEGPAVEGGDHEGEEHEDEEHDHGDLGDLNPHFWQDPLQMAAFVETLGERMAEVDADNAATYRENAATTVAELEELDSAYEQGLASCVRDVVVVNHDAFGYLSRYGLEFEPVTGFTPDAEPTAGDLARLQELIVEEDVSTVFYERLVSPDTARSLARDTGAETDVLDPIEGLTSDTRDQDYLSLMRTNLEALQQANGC